VKVERYACGFCRMAGVEQLREPVDADKRQTIGAGARTRHADVDAADVDLRSLRGRCASGGESRDPLSHCRAVLHARHDFLADIAALFEVQAGKTVHIRFVRKNPAVIEIDKPIGNAGGDSSRLIDRAVTASVRSPFADKSHAIPCRANADQEPPRQRCRRSAPDRDKRQLHEPRSCR